MSGVSWTPKSLRNSEHDTMPVTSSSCLRLEARGVTKSYRQNGRKNTVVRDVSFALFQGERLGVVGESGSGKSTLARICTLFERPDAGVVFIDGVDAYNRRLMRRKDAYRIVQMVFQNPQDSFSPHMRIGTALAEAAVNFGIPKSRAREVSLRMLERVGLGPDIAMRYRHQVSGGECQRAAIARALLASPAVLVCDEVTSALDVSVQAQVLRVLRDLVEESDVGLVFISHDLAIVQLLCDRVMVMHEGSCVEEGLTDEVLASPKSAYTRILVEAACSLDTSREGARTIVCSKESAQ